MKPPLTIQLSTIELALGSHPAPRALEKHLLYSRCPMCAERGEEPMTAGGGNFIGSEVKRKGVVSTVWSYDY